MDATNKILKILIDPGTTTADAIVDAINDLDGSPWTPPSSPATTPSRQHRPGHAHHHRLEFHFNFSTGYADTSRSSSTSTNSSNNWLAPIRPSPLPRCRHHLIQVEAKPR